jgi:hypothetical protein
MKRSIAENYKKLYISKLGALCVVFTLNQIQGLIEVFLKVRYSLDIKDLLASKFIYAKDHSPTLALGKDRKFEGNIDFFAAI